LLSRKGKTDRKNAEFRNLSRARESVCFSITISRLPEGLHPKKGQPGTRRGGKKARPGAGEGDERRGALYADDPSP